MVMHPQLLNHYSSPSLTSNTIIGSVEPAIKRSLQLLASYLASGLAHLVEYASQIGLLPIAELGPDYIGILLGGDNFESGPSADELVDESGVIALIDEYFDFFLAVEMNTMDCIVGKYLLEEYIFN